MPKIETKEYESVIYDDTVFECNRCNSTIEESPNQLLNENPNINVQELNKEELDEIAEIVENITKGSINETSKSLSANQELFLKLYNDNIHLCDTCKYKEFGEVLSDPESQDVGYIEKNTGIKPITLAILLIGLSWMLSFTSFYPTLVHTIVLMVIGVLLIIYSLISESFRD